MKKKKKNSRLSGLLITLVFLAGLSLMLYPTFSEQWNSMHQSQIINGYQDNVNNMDEDKYSALWQQANEFNAALRDRENPFILPDDVEAEYEACLDIYDNGTMAYLEIPSINCKLAVYHGTDEKVLQTNVGHLEWTSLPVGGESTHCILSGHRGLPSAELLTNIDRMQIGDVFYIHVLGEKLTYVVESIVVAEPTDIEHLRVFEGKDYVTLLTCTPYGINSHRLLVRGERVQTDNAAENGIGFIPNEVSEVNKTFLVILCTAGLSVLACVGFLMAGIFRKKRFTEDLVNKNEKEIN